MTNLKLFAITNVLCVWMIGSPQIDSFEKRALSLVQAMPASALDAELPSRSFESWFKKVIGPKAGVVWQLTECGEQASATGETGQDLSACAEVNASLSDGRKVFVVISVGTFKKGLTGKPTLFRAVIEQNERFYQVRRLSDLPETLSAPDGPSASVAKKRIADLPVIKMDSARIISPFRYLAPSLTGVPPAPGDLSQAEEPPPPARPAARPVTSPRQAEEPPAAAPAPTLDLEKVPEGVSLSRAITKVKPAYPPAAKKMNATGTVEVEITISEAGLVLEATAISGHLALRSAAVEAARKWVFKPATLNGEPVRVKSVLTFVFAPSAK